MKKLTLISGIVAIMLTTSSADFSFGEMYEQMKAVATLTTDQNISKDVVTDVNTVVDNNAKESSENISNSEVYIDKNVSSKVVTEVETVVDNVKESIETNSTDEKTVVSDENVTEVSAEENK